MNKYLKIGLIVFGVGLLVGVGAVYYVFNMPQRNVKKEKAAFTMTAEELFTEYSSDETIGNEKFADKVIQVTGEIVEIAPGENETTIVLLDPMEGVSCALDSIIVADNKEKIDKLKIGDEITLKGKCDGIDMIMGVVLTRCYFIIKEEV